MSIQSQKVSFRRRVNVYLAIFCVTFNTHVFTVLAGPEGATVVNGQVEFQQSGYNTTITASDRAIIDYSRFDITRPEIVQFIQPGSNATVLNRILSANPTQIDGTLLANGRVFFVNPAGVYIGSGARINVSQLVASSLNISNSDFINGQYNFAGGSGSVINSGDITADSVYLIGQQIINSGNIDCPGGFVVMASGDRVFLGETGSDVVVEIDVPVLPEQVEPIEGTAVLNEGTVEVGDGTILLTAAGDIYSQAISNVGALRASSDTADAGRVRLAAADGVVINSGVIEATSNSGAGGTVQVLGDKVGLLDGAEIDVSGSAGGGTVLVGGDYQGKGDTPTASRTYVSEDSTIRADAVENGDGGEVIIWADEVTYYAGQTSARGGAEGGDGGLVEVSGKDNLGFYGYVDTLAPQGNMGTLLLDPVDITISDADGTDGASAGDILFAEDPASEPWNVTPAQLDAVAGNIILQARDDIDFTDAVSLTTDGAGITARAGDDIVVRALLTTRGGALDFIANDSSGTQSGDGRVDFRAAVDTSGGGVSGGTVTLTVDGGTGYIRLDDNGGITTNAADIIFAGPVVLEANPTISTTAGVGGNIVFQGTIEGSSSDYYRDLRLESGTGNIDFDGIVGGVIPLDDVEVYGAADVTIDAAFYADSFEQEAGTGHTQFDGPMVIRGVSTAFRVTTNTVAINNTIDTLAGGNGGIVTITNAGLLDIAPGADITTDGAFTQNGAGAVQTAGDITTTDDDITFNGAVALTNGHAVAFDTGAGAGNITFGSTLDGTITQTEDLTLTAGTGNIDFDGIVGGTKAVGDVTVVSVTDLTADAAFTAKSITQTAGTGNTWFKGAVDTSGLINSPGGDVDITTTGNITFDSTITTSGGSTSADNAGQTGGAVTLYSTTGNINVYGTITTTGSDGLGEALMGDGYAAGVTGGAAGATVDVDNLADFETYATAVEPYIIRVTGTIDLDDKVRVKSNKTIIGVDSDATIIGRLDLHYDGTAVDNIIITNLNITNPDGGVSGDGISVWGATNIFISHCNIYDTTDGLLDITVGADNVTVAWCKFYYSSDTGHNFANLIGGSDLDTGEYHVTFHHNWWSTLVDQRMPATRFGSIHMYNNYFNSAGNNYASDARLDAELLSENNYYQNVDDPIYSSTGTGLIETSGNTYDNCTGTIDPGTDDVFDPPYSYTLTDTVDVPTVVQAGAGSSDSVLSGAQAGGTGGAVTITADDGSVSVAGINTSGGAGLAAGGENADGGPGGAITITSDTADPAKVTTITGDIIAAGGAPANSGTRGDGGAITFNSQTVVGSNASVNTGVTAGAITFGSTLDSATAYTEDLTLTAGTGNIVFNGVVGGNAAVGDVIIASATDVTAEGAFTAKSITQTSGADDTHFKGAVDTSGAADSPGGVVSITTTGDIDFDSTLDTSGGTASADSAGQAGGAVTLHSSAGHVDMDNDITTSGSAGNDGGGGAQAGGAGGAVTIIADDGTVDLIDVVTSGGDAHSAAADDADGGDAGAISVTSDTADPTKVTTLDGGYYTAAGGAAANSGSQGAGGDASFNSQVILSETVRVDTGSTAGTITFGDTVDGTADFTRDLRLTAGTGNIDFDGIVGSTYDLDDITIYSAADVTFDAALNADSFEQQAGTGDTQFDGAVAIRGVTTAFRLTTNTVTINNTIDTLAGASGGIMTITNAGLLDIAPGADITLDGTFTQNGAGAVQIAGDLITTGDDIIFGQPVTLTDGHSVAFSTGAGAGNITFQGTLDGTTANAEDLSLTAGTGNIDFDDVVGGTTALGDLTVVSATNVTADAAVSVDNLTQTAGTGTTQLDGVTTAASAISVSNGNVTINDDVTAGTTVAFTASDDESTLTIATGLNIQSTGGAHTYTADKMNIAGTITATGQTVTLRPESTIDDDAINLGSAVDTTSNTLELSNAELDNITATTLVIGESGQSGAITVSSDITPATATNLHLISNSTVTGTAGGLIVSNLAVESGGAVTMTDATTDVDTLAVDSTTGNIQFTDADGFSVGTVDSVAGVDTDGGSVTLTATTGSITIANTAAADDIGASTDIQLNSDTTAADGVRLTAGNDLKTAAGKTITAQGGLTLVATAGGITEDAGDDDILQINMSADDQTLTLTQSDALDVAGFTVTNDEDTDLVANSTGSTVTCTTAGAWQSIGGSASGNLTLTNLGNSDAITLSDLTSGGQIWVQSIANLTVPATATLTANGTYSAANDDRSNVYFQTDGSAIDVAIYLGSYDFVSETGGDVTVNSAISMSSNGTMVVDAYDTVGAFGTNFTDSAVWSVSSNRLEMVSRISTTMTEVTDNSRIPGADSTTSPTWFIADKYVVRGAIPLAELFAELDRTAPVIPGETTTTTTYPTFLPAVYTEPGSSSPVASPVIDTQTSAQTSAEEPGDDATHVHVKGAYIQSSDIAPFKIAVSPAETGKDTDPGLSALKIVVAEFAKELPVSREQVQLIDSVLQQHRGDRTHYNKAGQLLDALVEYGEALVKEAGYSHEEAVEFIMSNYGSELDETSAEFLEMYLQSAIEGADDSI